MCEEIRQEIKTIPGEEGEPPKLNWTVTEYNGVEVLTAPSGLTYEEILEVVNWPENFKPELIKDKDAVQEGSIVLIPGLFGGLGAYRIESTESGSLIGMSGSVMACLEFGEDDRNCWVCSGLANLKAVKKLNME